MDREIQIFEAGNYPEHGGEWGKDVVADVVASYDPELHEAPCVIGHPASDSPAHGWVKKVRATDDGRLFAVIDESSAHPGFLDLIEGGVPEAGGWIPFKKVSAKFYPPEDPYNPRPGHVSLRHIGFLGGEVPAVKGMDGLRPTSFKDDGSTAVGIEFDFVPGKPFKEATKMTIQERILKFFETLTGPKVKITPEFAEAFETQFGVPFAEAIKEPEPEPKVNVSKMPPEFAEKFTELETGYAAKIKTAEGRIAELEKGRKDDFTADRNNRIAEFIERVFNAGKILPSGRPILKAFLETVEPGSVEIEFAEEEKKTVDNLSLAFRFLEEVLTEKVKFDELTGDGAEFKEETSTGKRIASRSSSFQEQGGVDMDELATLIAEKLTAAK